MKLKIVVQIIVGFMIAYTITALTGGENAMLIVLSIFALGLIHELIHFVLIKMFRLRYRLLVNGLYVGFKTTFDNVNQFIVVAIAPQILTLMFILFYIITLNGSALALAVLHMAISCEDLTKVVRYLLNYFV